MLLGKRILVVIPARGGSKGIPRKNIAPLLGKPLISYTTQLLHELPWVDFSVVSTDDQDIAAEALGRNFIDIVWRPEELSGDRVGDMPVLAHALLQAEMTTNSLFDVVLMLQPTSPLRKAADVLDCARKLISEEWDAVWTVSQTNLAYHPEKQVRVASDGSFDFFLKSGSDVIARQQLQPAFHRNGVAYAFTTEFVRSAKSVFSPKRSGLVRTSGSHVSIDTIEDLRAAERVMIAEQRKNPKSPVTEP